MLALAVLVGVLALGAKLSLYDAPHPGSINPASISKLWVSGERLKTTQPFALPILWLATLLLFPLPVQLTVRAEPCKEHAPRHFVLCELYRFLRPPPAF